jgi:hypothetical protein
MIHTGRGSSYSVKAKRKNQAGFASKNHMFNLDLTSSTHELQLLPNSMANMDDKQKFYHIHLRAVAAMKNPPNPDFLGHKSDDHVPFLSRCWVTPSLWQSLWQSRDRP